MKTDTALGRLDHLSFKGNIKKARYGWLRLTPAYSVHLVSEILDAHRGSTERVLDPFCGTGTTALVCAERGIACDTTDINPFLLWLTAAKTRPYAKEDIAAFQRAAAQVTKAIQADSDDDQKVWAPPLHQIEKWWDDRTLAALSRVMCSIVTGAKERSTPVNDLLKVAFCRTMIERANVSFGHQSMSFKKGPQAELPLDARNAIADTWGQAVASIQEAAKSPIEMMPNAIQCDARELNSKLERGAYTCVITSPPYPNRMSYIRELRPYMYWLEFLRDGREAGELDWQAIGGTWGCATSNVGKWEPPTERDIPFADFATILERIAEHSRLLSRYVHKYFYDMAGHCENLFAVTAPGGSVNYIVGNSKFYDVLLPVEQIFASLFEHVGFKNVEIRTIRKRSSKKELFEYVVSAAKPGRAARVSQLPLISSTGPSTSPA